MANAREQPAKRLAGWAESIRLREHEDKVLLVLTLIIGAVVGLVAAAQQGRIAGAVLHYRRAIDGVWPGRAEENRAQRRMELARLQK